MISHLRHFIVPVEGRCKVSIRYLPGGGASLQNQTSYGNYSWQKQYYLIKSLDIWGDLDMKLAECIGERVRWESGKEVYSPGPGYEYRKLHIRIKNFARLDPSLITLEGY